MMDIKFSYKKLAVMLEFRQENDLVYGRYHDIDVAIYPNLSRFPVTIQFPYSISSVPLVKENIFDMANNLGIASAVEEERILLYTKEDIEKICSSITEMAYLIQLYNLKPGCARCGGGDAELYCADGEYGYLCPDCAAQYRRELSEFEKAEEKNTDLPAGMVGAFIGTLIGALIGAFFIWIDGFSPFLCLAIAFCGLMGFQKLGGEFNRKGVILTTALLMFAVYVMNRADIAYSLYVYTRDYAGQSLLYWYRSIPKIVSMDAESYKSYLLELLEMDVLTILSVAYFTISANMKSSKRRNKFRKLP